MWKHRHTAIVALCLMAGSAFGQWSAAWSNYFAVSTIAAECYSASVERCQAVGITPDEPSWYDYLLGKNHAKEVSIKENIKACRPYYCAPTNDVVSVLVNSGTDGLLWTNDTIFLEWCGLPTNSIDETPYFKSQYPSTTGGWHHIRAMLTNLVWSTNAVAWYPWHLTNSYACSDFSTAPFFGEIYELSVNPTYDYPESLHYSVFWPPSHTDEPQYRTNKANARGSWTTSSAVSTWADSWAAAMSSLNASFTSAPSTNGFSWTHPMNEYAVATAPKAVYGGVCDRYNYSITTNYSGTNDYSYTSNFVTSITITNTGTGGTIPYETNMIEVSEISVTNFTYTTNGVTNVFVSTNISVTISSNMPNGSYTTNAMTLQAGFGSTFVGSWWDYVFTNIAPILSPSNITVLVTSNVLQEIPNVSESTNIIPYSITNEVPVWTSGPSGPEDTWYLEVETNILDSITTNTIFNPTGIVSIVTNGSVKYACGATTISSYPYIGDTSGLYPDMTLPVAPFERVIDFYVYQIDPTNIPPMLGADAALTPWHGYNASSPANITNYTLVQGDWLSSESGVDTNWSFWCSSTSANTVASGNMFGGVNTAGTPPWLTDGYMFSQTIILETSGEPSMNQVTISGFEVTDQIAIERWNVMSNGFKYK